MAAQVRQRRAAALTECVVLNAAADRVGHTVGELDQMKRICDPSRHPAHDPCGAVGTHDYGSVTSKLSACWVIAVSHD